MAKKKLRKKILLIIILLILLLLILVITMKNLNSSTSKEMLNRLISGLDNLNYTYNDGEMDIHIVGKYGKGSTLETEKYIDYNDKITRELYSDHFMEEYQNNGFKDMEYYKEYIEYYFSNNMYTYKYVGKKKIDNKKCTVIKFINEVQNKEDHIWIDDSTNLIVKIEYYSLPKNKMREETFNFCSDSTKVEEVKVTQEKLSDYTTETNG